MNETRRVGTRTAPINYIHLAIALIGFTAISSGTVNAASAQSSVTGQVRERGTDRPVVGATAAFSGSQTSAAILTQTDTDGRFRLDITTPGPGTLRVTAPGYVPHVRSLDPRTAISPVTIELVRTAYRLSDIVVTATGEQPQRALGHTVTVIDAANIVERRAITELTDILVGRAPGLAVMPSDGMVGSGAQIRIRGSNSMFRPNDPIVYVDGVRVDATSPDFTISTGAPGFSRLGDINPDDIASIEVIRGPSAATMYGADAANGIIRITTKRGTAGATRWNLRIEQGVTQPVQTFLPNYFGVDAAGATCVLEDVVAGNCTQVAIRTFNGLNDPETRPFASASLRQYHVDVSGGASAVRYYVGGDWDTEDGVQNLPPAIEDSLSLLGTLPTHRKRPNRRERMSFRATIDATLGDFGNVSVSGGLVSSDARRPFTGLSVFNPLATRSTDPDNPWTFPGTPAETYRILNEQSVERSTWSLTSHMRPISFLELRSTAGFDHVSLTDQQHVPPGGIFRTTGRRIVNQREASNYTGSITAILAGDLSRLIASRTALGFQYHRSRSYALRTTADDLVEGTTSITGAGRLTGSEATMENASVGIFIDQHFNLDDRLFLSAGLRADDNSNAGRDFDYIIYPRLGASWIVSEEEFFPRSSHFSNFRLRFAWGAAGVQPGQNDALLTFARRRTVIDGSEVIGLVTDTPPNPELRPERSREFEFGLDAGFLNDRVELSATRYHKQTQDALFLRPIAPSLGAGGSRWENIGQVNNSGFELGLEAVALDNPSVYWRFDTQYSTNRNVIVRLCPPDTGSGRCEDVEPYQPSSNYTQMLAEGYPVGAYFSNVFDFADANGDGIIDPSEVSVSDSVEYAGPAYPTKLFSLGTTLMLGNRLELGAIFDYRGGHLIENGAEHLRCVYSVCRGANDATQSAETMARAMAVRVAPQASQSLFLESAWVAKLRELSVTLMAPSSMVRFFGGRQLDVTLAVRNLLTFTDYSRGDPEINSATGDAFLVRDSNAQAPVRHWIAKIHIGF